MTNLFEPKTTGAVKARLAALRADSPRQWGKMNPAQAMAHCARGMELAVGDQRPSRMFIGRLIGPLVKSKLVATEDPMRRNAPTDKRLIVADDRDLDVERRRLIELIDRFWVRGPQGCTTHPHTFFGALTPDEWAILMYKHLDHHLRQFDA
jgi:hypothetical protein